MQNLNCEICKRNFDTLGGLSNHVLKSHKEICPKNYYNLYLIKDCFERVCPFCGKENKFIKFTKGYHTNCGSKECVNKFREKTCLEKYGCINVSRLVEVQEKTVKTFLEKYGVKRASQSHDVKEKAKSNCLKNHGVEYPSQQKDFNEKIKQTWGKKTIEELELINCRRIETCLEKYGTESSNQVNNVKDKKKIRFLQKYGVENPFQSEEVKLKIKQTSKTKYGCFHPMHNVIIFDKCQKNSFKSKDYKFPSGKIIKVQGYENHALDELFQEGYLEDELIVRQEEMPEIYYFTSDSKKHRYYPDIFIPKDNIVIEVKSNWTLDGKEIYLEKNILKAQACLDAGYKFVFKIIKK